MEESAETGNTGECETVAEEIVAEFDVYSGKNSTEPCENLDNRQ